MKKIILILLFIFLSIGIYFWISKPLLRSNYEKNCLSAGDESLYLIKDDGSLWVSGVYDDNKTFKKKLENVRYVSAYQAHVFIIKNDNTLWAEGDNFCKFLGPSIEYGTKGFEKIMDDVSTVSTTYHTLIIKTDGTLWSMGFNFHGQLGNGKKLEELGTGEPNPIKIMDNVVKVSAGNDSSMALKKDGSLWGFGSNSSGELGLGADEEFLIPTKVMDDVIDVSCGDGHTLILKKDKSLWVTGLSSNGQTGLFYKYNENISHPTLLMKEVIKIHATNRTSMIIKKDGTLWGFGNSSFGQMGLGKEDVFYPAPIKIMDNVEDVAFDAEATIIKTKKGKIFTFGFNRYGKLGTGNYNTYLTPIEPKFTY